MLNIIQLRKRKRRQQSDIMLNNTLVVAVVLTVCLALSGRGKDVHGVLPVEAFLIPSSSSGAARTFTATTTALNALDFTDLVHQGMSVDTTNVHHLASSALHDISSTANTAFLISDDESTGVSVASIRQYVPLAVSLFVIVDILLGSPFVNLLMKPMRDASMEAGAGPNSNTISRQDREEMKKKERVDTDRVAQDAIDRAQNALELRNYLDSRKSDWDKMEDMKKGLDQSMQKLDDELDAKQRAFDSRND